MNHSIATADREETEDIAQQAFVKRLCIIRKQKL